MFRFFPNNYMWSQAVLRLLFTGGAPGEALKGASELVQAAETYDNEAWFRVWRDLGDQLYQRARLQERDQHPISARSSFLRACSYYQWSTGFMDHHDQRRRDVHQRSLEAFGRYAELSEPRIEHVEVPYEGASYPAWFVPGRGAEARKLTVFYLPGWDSTKEQGVEFGVALSERGYNALLVDWPGMGEAVLLRGMVNRYDEEVPGAAAVDYLLTRPDVDPARIVVVGASMGGYRASRVAAFEKRLAAAVAWGAVWDYGAAQARRRAVPQGAVSTPPAHAMYVMGAATEQELIDKLSRFKLEEVAGQIACPFLVLHGEKDAQLSLDEAYALYNGAGSPQKELKVFTEAEGGSFHCQNDNRELAHEYIGDWLEDTLNRGKRREGVVIGPGA
jgi:alpha-beta hydrolase superfamily lysophospholipase